ncbi:chromosomal replication initiator protein DnaA [Patescibacteria group bacterium]
MDNNELWQSVLSEIELSISKAQFITWFKDTAILSNQDGHVVIGVPNGFTKEWLENKFNKHILNSLRRFQGDVKEITCQVYNPQQEEGGVKKNTPSSTQKKDLQPETPTAANQTYKINFNQNTNLNPRYTFENFVVGENNELARAACYSVSQKLGQNYNPLFIYGDVGLGKTHLLQSIGNEVLKNQPDKQVIYISSEGFTSELVNSIKNQRIEQFKNKYQKADLLIIDDIQFISGKEKTQDIFFHIFNSLYQINKQIVISSDRPPKEIQILEDRLKSRFEGGMITDIGNPDLETRIAILKMKLTEKNFFLEENIIRFIAENIKNNIRELEGALNKVIANYELTKQSPQIDVVRKMLLDISSTGKKKGITHRDVIQTVADFYDLTYEDLVNKGRRKRVAIPRQIAMFIIRNELKSSYPEIGEFLGGRDHTTVMHAFKKIDRELKEDTKLKENIEILVDKIFTV